MFGQYYYFHTVRNIVAAFGTMFNDIQVTRSNGKVIDVPIAYAPKTKFLARINEDYGRNGVVVKTSLPRLSFNLDGIQYDPARQINRNDKFRVAGTGDAMFNPVPYNYNFTLSLWSDNIDDALQIVEQILPIFAPDFNITIIDIAAINLTNDVPVSIEATDLSDSFEGSLLTKREINWDISFTLRGYIYPRISLNNPIIKTSSIIIKELGFGDVGEVLETITNAINPLTAFELDPHTVDETITKG